MGIVYVVLLLWGVASLALALVWIAYVELVLARQSRKGRATGTHPDGGSRRLRSFWRSALSWFAWIRFQRDVTEYARLHRKFRDRGVRLDGGSNKLSASTIEREPGTPTRATATTAACSSFYPLGADTVVRDGLTLQVRAISSTSLGAPTFRTAAPGVSGVPPEDAD